jgi:cytochrome c551/c552
MAAGSSLKTDAQKRMWWQQRVRQDQRMAQIVQQLDVDWLGPWRCLLMQPQRSAAEAAAAAAAADILSEHFCALGESSRRFTRRPSTPASMLI